MSANARERVYASRGVKIPRRSPNGKKTSKRSTGDKPRAAADLRPRDHVAQGRLSAVQSILAVPYRDHQHASALSVDEVEAEKLTGHAGGTRADPLTGELLELSEPLRWHIDRRDPRQHVAPAASCGTTDAPGSIERCRAAGIGRRTPRDGAGATDSRVTAGGRGFLRDERCRGRGDRAFRNGAKAYGVKGRRSPRRTTKIAACTKDCRSCRTEPRNSSSSQMFSKRISSTRTLVWQVGSAIA